jgi:ABC-type branched-subunit amino acid transport system substrate-binding protein
MTLSRRATRAVAAVSLTTLSALMAACAANGASGGSGGGGTLTFGVLMPFSGALAPDGIQTLNGCLTASYAINQAGGILGHKVACQENDTRSDPVDTVPAAQKMLSTTSNLAGVFGPDSGVAFAVTPMLQRAKMTMFSVAGDPVFDKNTDPYFYRLTPADDLAARSLAIYAKDRGFTRIALVFTTDGSAQTNDPPLVAAAKILGLKITANLQILADQSSYRSEVATLAASFPQAILTETDPQTTGTFFGELAQAGGLTPMIVTAISLYPAWQTAIKTAIGQSGMVKDVSTVVPYAAPTGKGWQLYAQYIKHAPGTDPKQFTTDQYARSQYDGGVLMALAMTKAKSTVPAVYNKYITQIMTPGAGKTVVYSYAQGKQALAAGKSIQYIGAGGFLNLNKYHNVNGVFEIERWQPSGGFKLVGAIPEQQIAAINLR